MKTQTTLLWISRIVAAIIMLQTLFFKFTAAPESVYIFTKVGIEPWGRIGSGIAELLASLLIIFPKTSIYGAILAVGVMAGAIASHLFILGIEVMGDHGQLFIYALLVTISSLYIIWVSKNQLLLLLNRK
ncbi:DoxX family protein [Parasediminibacterium sp. JCM 36343]|uniref:DoxX family protein n=1 Tax=Parasediminibacterium sp. JCM 36343 TaxID=3374279 RepID=UPI00397B3ECC